MLNSGTLGKKLISGLLDGSLGDLVVKVEAHDGSVHTWRGSAREREHDALGDVVEGAVRLEANGLPFIGAEDPVAHVVDGGVSSGGSGREFTEINDLSTTLLNAGSELISDPGSINELRGSLAGDGAIPDIGVHRGRVVTPNGHLLDISDLGAGLKSELGEGTVVIKAGHGSEGRSGKIGSVVLADQGVGVSGVADDDGLDITRSVVVDSLADINEDSTVVLQQIATLHARSTRLGTNKEVVVDVLEGSGEVTGDDDLIEEGEGAVMELSLDTTEDLLLEGQIEEVEDDALVLAKELTTVN